VYFHKLGADPKQDIYVIGEEFPRIAEIKLQASENGRWLVAAAANGDGGQLAYYVMDSSGPLDSGHAPRRRGRFCHGWSD
jgi:prolyl oligopeptidase